MDNYDKREKKKTGKPEKIELGLEDRRVGGWEIGVLGVGGLGLGSFPVFRVFRLFLFVFRINPLFIYFISMVVFIGL